MNNIKYQKMVDKNRSKEERTIFEKNFVMDVKKSNGIFGY